MKNMKALKKLEILIANISTKSCKEYSDDIVNTNDILHIIGFRTKVF